jgi:hypothetical protein
VTSYRIIRNDRAAGGKVSCEIGEIVYDQKGYDYGLSSDDTRYTGVEHISVTRKSDGDYPGFTIPRMDLEEIKT